MQFCWTYITIIHLNTKSFLYCHKNMPPYTKNKEKRKMLHTPFQLDTTIRNVVLLIYHL